MTLRPHLHLVLVALVIGGFVFVAVQRLATVPVYEIDEAYTLQVPYEMVNRGNLALPMYRYLGGNIENVWHSLTPLFFLILSAFLKVFGCGIPQGRVFNVITVVLTLWMVFLIGRRLFNWRVGLIAVSLITADQTVLERTRLLRNDYIAEALALLAFYLYDLADQRKSGKLYVASGLAAGAGVMCHSTILYMLGAICLLMLLTEGRRIFLSKKLYQFLAGAFAAMSYEIVYDIIDYKNLLMQYRADDLHFGILSLSGWWTNLLDEPIRFVKWYTASDVTFYIVPRTLLHLFQGLTIIAVIYLIVRCARCVRRGNALSEPRVRLLIVTVAVLLFLANIAHKAGYYNAHLVTWFGLCVGVMLTDGVTWIERLRWKQAQSGRLQHWAAATVVVLGVVGYGFLLVKQQATFIKEIRNPALASFQEMKSVLRSIVPDELCPVAVKTPVMWLAFPEKNICFASIDRRMAEAAALDIDGKDYALIVRPKSPDYWARDLDNQHHLIGELTNTPYGNFLVYYTGNDPQYLTEPKRYHFFRRWAGHVSGEQLGQAREVWAAAATELSGSAKLVNPSVTSEGLAIGSGEVTRGEDTFTELCSVELKPSTAYELVFDSKSSEEWEAIVTEETGLWIKQIELRGGNRSSELFRTFAEKRVRILVRALTHKSGDPLLVSRIGIREIGEL